MQNRAFFLALCLGTMTGCVHQGALDFEVAALEQPAGTPAPPADVQEIAVGGEPSVPAHAPPLDAPPPVVTVVQPSTDHRRPPDPVLFRLGAGYGALGHVDLAPCRDQGLPAGYLHMRVTFRPSGRIVRAAIESPAAPSREALACIGERLELTMVPVFEGGDVTLSKSFFLN